MQPSQSARTGNRPGISLLEVLISISILAVGLLSIAALIPAGHYALLETTKADRSAACGRAAKGEILTRSMINPVDPEDETVPRLLWYRPSGGGSGFTPAAYSPTNNWTEAVSLYDWNVKTNNVPLMVGNPFVIDSLSYAEQVQNGDDLSRSKVTSFPFDMAASVNSNPLFGGGSINGKGLLRLTYDPTILYDPVLGPSYDRNNASYFWRSLSSIDPICKVIESINLWQDDLVFHADKENADRRGEQVFYWDDGVLSDPLNGDEDPNEKADATAHPVQVAFGGDYSWMMTVQPSLTEVLGAKYQAIASNLPIYPAMAEAQKTFDVSVVVYHKRDLVVPEATGDEPLAERMVKIDSISGSDLTLKTVAGKEYLAIKPNDWIMLIGTKQDATSPVTWHRTAKWFRVLAVDEEPTHKDPNVINSPWIRSVTLDGPDIVEALGNPVNVTDIHAVLADGVIGVYTTTVRLD
jgi:hypothetical protein